MINPLQKIVNVYRQWKVCRDMPLRLEFVVTDYCNLNCKGCTHYSALAPREFEPLDRLEHSVAHLSQTCGAEVAKAYLIGGETLLYPQLAEAIRMLRRYFPSQELYVFTNGIALPKMNDDFWNAARQCDIIIAVTLYPINFDYDAVLRLCADKCVRTEIFGDRSADNSFFKFGLDPAKKQNGRLAHFRCYQRGCVSVLGDRVYPCSISGCVKHLNRAFGTSFKHETGDWIDVDSVRSAKDIYRLRSKPVPFCRYCTKAVEVKYGPSRRDKSEWVI